MDPVSGTHQVEDLGAWKYSDEPCFVRQEIIFNKNSKLVFTERAISESKEKSGGTIYIVCKTLRIIDGAGGCQHAGPIENEMEYPKTRNLITHIFRLLDASPGPSTPPPSKPSNYDSNVYANSPNPARDGQKGKNGDKGKLGGDGMKAPNLKIYVGTLVYRDISLNPGSLTIDFRGQDGGKGGKGQDGGEGGDGEKGRPGASEDPWNASPRCTRQPGPGGRGGDGGKGGDGGDGGAGGEGAEVEVFIPSEQELDFKTRVCIDNSGGSGGKGGQKGTGGSPGKGGDGGDAPDGCIPVIMPSPAGNHGGAGDTGIQGDAGKPGVAVEYKDLVHQVEMESCLEPLLFYVDGINPNQVSRGTDYTVEISGTGFESLPTVNLGNGITVNNVTYDNAKQLTVDISVGTGLGCPLGTRDISVTNPKDVEKKLADGLEVIA